MSEFLNNDEQRREDLSALGVGLVKGEKGLALIDKYNEAIQSVIPEDVYYFVDQMVRAEKDMEVVKKAVSKVLNILYKPLKRFTWDFTGNELLENLVLDNAAMDIRLKEFKEQVKRLNAFTEGSSNWQETKTRLSELLDNIFVFEKHYLIKENVLFPKLEEMLEDYRCMHVMWSIHDDFRKSIKKLSELLKQGQPEMDALNSEFGNLFFSVYPVIFREEMILFPVAGKIIKPEEWDVLFQLSLEIGFAFVNPEVKTRDSSTDTIKPLPQGTIDLKTGALSAEQLIGIFSTLPVDITFVDEHDEVRYFSDPKDRIFTRTKAIIGRKVQNCHPPESMHVVEEILTSFKSGEKEVESFWINIKGKFILIQYYAVRNETGKYLGTLEVSMDASWIRSLDGEKRLLG